MTTPGRPEESLALPPPRDAALLSVAILGVAGSGPLIAATVAPALAISFWRNALGALATGTFVAVRDPRRFRAVDRRSWRVSAVAGVLLSIHFATWVPSVTMTTVASSTALVATQPVWAAVLAAAAGRRLPRRAWLGIAGAVVATALITGADVGLSGRAVAGDVLAVVGGIFAAAYVTAGASARTRMSTSTYTTVCYGVCAILLAGACLVGRQPLHGFGTDAWLKILAVTVVAQLLGHSLINVVLRSVSPTLVSLAILFEPVGAGIIAFGWLHQVPPASAYPGFALLLASLAVVISSRARRDPVESTE